MINQPGYKSLEHYEKWFEFKNYSTQVEKNALINLFNQMDVLPAGTSKQRLWPKKNEGFRIIYNVRF